MTVGQLIIDSECSAGHALAHGSALPSLLSAEQSVALYAAELTGDDTFVLGRYQLASQALPHEQIAASLRRASGGTTVRAGAGISYVALALHQRSSLMACPPNRLLNRNVRGVLQGLRAIGAQANYFGRDFVSFGAAPAAFIAWDARSDGTVLLELFVSHTRSCFVTERELAYPARREPALRGQTPVTLATVGVSASAVELADALARAHAKQFGVSWTTVAPALLTPHVDTLVSSADTAEERLMHWSSPREEAIGFVSAGVRLDGAGKLAAVSMVGDFFAHRSCAATLSRTLSGVSPNSDLVARSVDAAFAHASHDLEGIRSLRTFQDAITDAAQTAAEAAHDERSVNSLG